MGFGFLEAILSWLNSQVGKRTDAADPAGSLHAKTGDIKNYLVNTIDAKLGTSTDGRANNTLFGFTSTQIKSIQRGLTNVSSYPTNVTISAVNTAKAFVSANGRAQSASTSYNYGGGITARLTSSTNLELNSGFSDGNNFQPVVVSWEVVEFY